MGHSCIESWVGESTGLLGKADGFIDAEASYGELGVVVMHTQGNALVGEDFLGSSDERVRGD
jgi:hypothetical protein